MCGAIFYLVIFQFESYALHYFLCDFGRRPIQEPRDYIYILNSKLTTLYVCVKQFHMHRPRSCPMGKNQMPLPVD